MGLFDWLGPLSAGGKRRGWDALPAAPERKEYPWIQQDSGIAIRVGTLVHGPGATDLLAAQHGNDSNSAVYACLEKIATAIAEPELKVYRVASGKRVEQDGTPIGDLLRSPNPHMTLDQLLAYLSNCLRVDGNAYWRKLRAGNELTGNVVELWPISPTRIEPKTQPGSGDFISFYRYYLRPGKYDDIDPENIVHFRTGLDDRDHRVGCSPLKRLAREVSSDEQATRYADRLLANLAVNGLSVEWDKDTAPIDQKQAEEIKAKIQAAYSGDNVGSVAVLSPGAKLVSHGFSPEQMDLKILHRVPEERIAAVLGVPAIVAGLGAGLDRSTYSNFKEAREAFTEMTLIPLWRALAATITLQLLPDFKNDANTVVDFDISDVRALATDENAKATRLDVLVRSAQITLNEARAEQGLEPIEGGDVLLVPGAWAPTPPAHLAALAAAPAPVVTASGGPPTPATRSRPRIVTLPLARKGLDDLPASFESLREGGLPDWEAALSTFLEAQLARVVSRLKTGQDSAEGLVVEGEATLLGDTLAPLQSALLSDVQALVLAELGVVFDLDDAATREFLRGAASNIGGITETTRAAVRAELVAGQQAGEGVEQLARRLQALVEFGPKRARMVARTELGHASNLAALANYRASGVVAGVRVFDGDYDAACAAMNGRVFALGQEPATLQHPNCRRAFAPILDAAELTRSA